MPLFNNPLLYINVSFTAEFSSRFIIVCRNLINLTYADDAVLMVDSTGPRRKGNNRQRKKKGLTINSKTVNDCGISVHLDYICLNKH